MPQPETRAWWSDVQHVRDSIERRREREANRSLRLDARAAARAVAEREDSTRRDHEPTRRDDEWRQRDGSTQRDHEPTQRDDERRRRELTRRDHDPTQRDGELTQVGEIPSGVHDFLQSDEFEWATRPGRRFERSTPERRGRFARGDHGSAAQTNPLEPPPRRRTVEITGHPVGGPTLPRLVEIDRRRPARRAVERVGPRPDRIALWAVVLGFFLILVAVTSTSHAATRAASAQPSAGHTAHSQVVRAHTATLRANPPAR
jgi:hypothetical protein